MDIRQAKLMLKLADHLHAHKEPKKGENGVGFDMATFYDNDASDGHGCFKNHPCGTAACALGHAGLMPCFRRIGLKTNRIEGTVCFGKVSEWDAASDVFGIPSSDSFLLFGAHDRTAKQEAKVLREFVYERFPQLKKAVKK